MEKSTDQFKILILDIETAPILAHVWALFDQNVGLNQIMKDWHVLSWSAKWLGDDKVMYMGQEGQKDISNDKKILKGIWKLLDRADGVITQNGKKFDIPKLNARFVLNGMKPPSPFEHIDVCQIARSKFKFTSNKLEYLADKLSKKHKKQQHKRFPGHQLWTECLAGNPVAWKEMEKYNKYDVLALEEVYYAVAPYAKGFTSKNTDGQCECGGSLIRNGYRYTPQGVFRRLMCKLCGKHFKSTKKKIKRYT